jgi:hypothetical protein
MTANPGMMKIEREHLLLHGPFQCVAVPGDDPQSATPCDGELLLP